MDSAWLAFHIFYDGEQDALLLRCIRPLITELRQSRRINEYFFVRYWNGGPHIRLRIKAACDPEWLRATVCSAVQAFLRDCPGGRELKLEEYMERAEARRDSGARFGLVEEIEPLHAPDSVQVRDYAYEAGRYGAWPEARSVTESHFRFSSDLAMFVIGQTEASMDARLTLGLYLTAATACAMGVGLHTAEKILMKTSETFGGAARGTAKHRTLAVEGRDFPDFEQLRDQLQPLIDQLSNNGLFRDDEAGLNMVLKPWRTELRNSQVRLKQSAPCSTVGARLNLVGIDYMHMLNNRLGIPVDCECHAYRLVARALRQVVSKSGYWEHL